MQREDKPLVAGPVPLSFWTILIAASVALIVGRGSLEAVGVFLAVGGVMGALILAYRLSVFNSKASSLLDRGHALEPYDSRAQAKKGVLLMGAVLAAFFAPLFLGGVLDASSWIGSVFGAIDGWLVSLIAYNSVLRLWEGRHGGKLYQSQVWRGTKVTHTGLKFERRAS